MSYVAMTCELDSASLRALTDEVFPQLLAAGRRTIQEQCVTSATFIAARAQKGMAFVVIGTIDAELEVEVFPLTATGRPSKAKKPKKFSVAPQKGVRVPIGVLIVMARMNEGSKYNKDTGSRWELPNNLPTGKGTKQARMGMIAAFLQKMTMARHSSTHFLLTGWTPAIRDGLASDLYRYNASFGSRRDASAVGNAGVKKTGDVRALGQMTIEVGGDDCVVTTSNDLGGEGTNDVLLKKYREALIEQGAGPLEAAIDQEVADGEKELKIRFYMKAEGLNREMVNIVYFPK